MIARPFLVPIIWGAIIAIGVGVGHHYGGVAALRCRCWALLWRTLLPWRAKYDYEVAIEDMIEGTSTRNAPWHIVPANDNIRSGHVARATTASLVGR